jgi:hypothetical protein
MDEEKVFEKSQLLITINQAVNESDVHQKLLLTHIIMHSLTIEESKKAKELHKYLDNIRSDLSFMRMLKLNSTIKKNEITAIEYLGKDYRGGDDNMRYNAEFEELLLTIETKIEEYLGEIIKTITKIEDGISFNV